MMVKRTLLVCALACLGANQAVAAQQTVDAAKVEKDMQRLLARTQQLQQEVNALRQEVKRLKHKDYEAKRTQVLQRGAITNKQKPKKQAPVPQPSSNGIENLKTTRELLYLGGTPVITSPYLGVRSNYDGSDLIVNISSINEDLRLLEQSQKLENTLSAAGYPRPQHPLLELSGEVEANAFATRPYVGRSTGDVDLSTVELDAFADINTWVNGFISLNYDNSPPAVGRQRTTNSRVFANKAFVTIGNLNRLPVYVTAGQYYVPFGRYSSNMIASTLPQLLARTKARAVQLGYKQPGEHGLYAAVYGFNGDSGAGATGVGGANLGYEFENGEWHGDLGGSVISNMADADGMQGTGGTGFVGFGATAASEMISRKIPAIDGHANVGVGPVTFIGEYVTATRHFSPVDLIFGSAGAKPSAWQIESSYRWEWYTTPMSFSVAYGETSQALALNLPQKRFLAAFNMALWRNTIQTLEYRHDINYPVGAFAAGRGATGLVTPVLTGGALGHTADTITAQLGVYF